MKKTVLRYRDKVVFERVEMNADFARFPKLFQEEEACFIYLGEGSFSFRTPLELIKIQAGEGVLAKCGNYFIEPTIKQTTSTPIIVFGAYFYPEMVKEFFETDIKLVAFKQNFSVNISKVEPMLKLYMESLSYLVNHPSLADENMLVNKLKELLLILGKTENSIHDFINALFTPFEYDFKQVIERNLYSSLLLVELAGLCGCSLATFKRRFRKYYDQSPAKYIKGKKLEKSFQLLSIKSKTISEIAFECGFTTVNHFHKAFKKAYGYSPSRSRLSQNDESLSF